MEKFRKATGLMCDPVVQAEVWRSITSVPLDDLSDFWHGISTGEMLVDFNVYDAQFGADEECLNVVVYPVHKHADGFYRVDVDNVIGRATIRECDVV